MLSEGMIITYPELVTVPAILEVFGIFFHGIDSRCEYLCCFQMHAVASDFWLLWWDGNTHAGNSTRLCDFNLKTNVFYFYKVLQQKYKPWLNQLFQKKLDNICIYIWMKTISLRLK